MTDLPEPLVPAEVDLRGDLMPRALFIALAVSQFGVSEEEAAAWVDDALARRRRGMN